MLTSHKNLINRRHITAKGDDQIAYENGYICEQEVRHEEALAWFAEVKPTGDRWDVTASAERIAILLARGRADEAAHLSIGALTRMSQPSFLLIGEAARAWNKHQGPEHALTVWQTWANHPAIRDRIQYSHDTAAYAAQCGQYAISLQGLLEWLQRRNTQNASEILLDMDFLPLWQHLAEGPLTQAEAHLLCSPLWPADVEGLSVHSGTLSFESYAHVPLHLRPMLCLNTIDMAWHPRPNIPKPLLQAYAAWRKETRQAHFEKLLVGRRKAFAFRSPAKAD